MAAISQATFVLYEFGCILSMGPRMAAISQVTFVLYEIGCILPMGPISIKSALIQIMAWHPTSN